MITIALIDSMPREVPTPLPPLRAEAFVPLKATLVLAPSHLLKQWPREVEKFSGGALKTIIIHTMSDINKLTIKELQKADVVVCAITLLRNVTPPSFRILLPSQTIPSQPYPSQPNPPVVM